MHDYNEKAGAPGIYTSPQRPGMHFHFDPKTLSMVPVQLPANGETADRPVDADAFRLLGYGEAMRLIVKTNLPSLGEEGRVILLALKDAPAEKTEFYAWAKAQGVCDPQSKESWERYIARFVPKSAANAEPRARIRTPRDKQPTQTRVANGILDDFLSFVLASSSGTVSLNGSPAATTPAPVSLPPVLAAPAAPMSLAGAFEGHLVQADNDPHVYLIENGLRRWVNSEAVMRQHFNRQLVNGRWTNVDYVSPQILASFAEGAPVTA